MVAIRSSTSRFMRPFSPTGTTAYAAGTIVRAQRAQPTNGGCVRRAAGSPPPKTVVNPPTVRIDRRSLADFDHRRH
jgi:hypothetical protein